MTDWLGRMLGKVRIDSLLARGGMAEVYLGEHTTLQREVAVKILRNQYEDDPGLLERFQREARVVAKLRHPNIVQVFDYDTIENHPYLVMEYIPGLSLSRYLHALHAKNGRLDVKPISRILTRVASALQFAHESGVIHRDIKPGNILLTSRSSKVMAGKPLPEDFEPILTDFGLVRFLNSSRQTTAGQIAGTPAYMSPEQARGEPTDERTDIYSLGVVLYELLSGHVPFDGETTMGIILKHVTEPPPQIPGLAPPLQRVLDRALAKKPEQRYQTPNDLADAFNELIDESGGSATIIETDPNTTHITTVGYNVSKSRKWVPALIAGAAIVFTGAFFLFRQYSTPTPIIPPTGNTLPTSPTVTLGATEPSLLSLGPTGVIHFQNGAAILDAATLTASAMPAPPPGYHYEVWLSGNGQRENLGVLLLDQNGKGKLAHNDEAAGNFLALYDQVEVIVEPDSDLSPDPIGPVAYSFSLPDEGLIFLRNLLVSFPETPGNVSLVQGLVNDAERIYKSAQDMQAANQKGSRAATRKDAEAILNLLAGAQSPDHKDWDGDGQVTDPGDGFGLLPNGSDLGYIQLVYSHADYAVVSPGATQNMIVHGGAVKTCAQNFARWAPNLRELVLQVLQAAPGADLTQTINEAVVLAGQLLNGMDTNNDQKVDAVAGECGALTARDEAYSMADMPLLPTGTMISQLLGTETATPTATSTAGTGVATTGSNNGGGGTSGSQPTVTPNTNPNKKPTSTKKPGTGKPPTNTPRSPKPKQ